MYEHIFAKYGYDTLKTVARILVTDRQTDSRTVRQTDGRTNRMGRLTDGPTNIDLLSLKTLH